MVFKALVLRAGKNHTGLYHPTVYQTITIFAEFFLESTVKLGDDLFQLGGGGCARGDRGALRPHRRENSWGLPTGSAISAV